MKKTCENCRRRYARLTYKGRALCKLCYRDILWEMPEEELRKLAFKAE